MKNQYGILVMLSVLALASPARAETNLGITLEQGNNGRPVVVDVTPQVGNFKTLGAYLQLRPGDEIYKAHSDPILHPDGNTYEKWDIKSIENLRWVLARTNSRIGLTVKRNGTYIKTVAVYAQVQQQRMTSTGPVTFLTGDWHLAGPEALKDP